jgi:hypothetical protein
VLPLFFHAFSLRYLNGRTLSPFPAEAGQGRYRSDNQNPDLGDTSFAQAVPTLNSGKHTAIPRTNADSNNANLINANAFTAGFHFGFIE